MASCVRNIRTKNYQNLITGFWSYSQKCWGCVFGTQSSSSCCCSSGVLLTVHNLLSG